MKSYTILFKGELTVRVDEAKIGETYHEQQDAIWDAINEQIGADELMHCVADFRPANEDEDGCFAPDEESRETMVQALIESGAVPSASSWETESLDDITERYLAL